MYYIFPRRTLTERSREHHSTPSIHPSIPPYTVSTPSCLHLFTDTGAFHRHSIQLSWLGCALYPCLLLGYARQATFISGRPAAQSNQFYSCVSTGWLYTVPCGLIRSSH
ncbi:hypothetical protein CC78DRAFT_178156 [Lojkania enalia]|uniref:K+ potassium transporter integral membrane domain-containing protein n=1 Tax=Lojkania enalia TaxID=147567 RepID=A0A9P4MUH0_9PLEO|nr:hypothetical protein CC78DRAFT_178156 [Didymosphaeria enalia]